MLLAISIVLLVSGLGLVFAGVRGRRVDDHPVCRGCGFDLVGLAGPARCPECGRALEGRRSVRNGTRRRRAGLIVCGVIVAGLGAGGAGAAAFAGATGFDWNTVKPAWLLARELAASQDLERAGAALSELETRLADGRLDRSGTDRLIGAVLRRQADERAPWIPDAGALLEAMIVDGRASREQAAAYLERAIRIEIVPRESHLEGGHVWTLQRVRLERTSGSVPFAVAVRFSTFSVGDSARWSYGVTPPGIVAGLQAAGAEGVQAVTERRTGVPEDGLRTLDDGIRELVVLYGVRILHPDAPGIHDAKAIWENGDDAGRDVLFETSGRRETRVRTVSSAREIIRLNTDEDAIEGTGLLIDADRILRRTGRRHGPEGEIETVAWYELRLTVGEIGHAIGYEVFVVIDGREVAVGMLARRPEPWGMTWTSLPIEPELLEGRRRVPVVLRASPEAALSHPEIEEIVAGRILFREVPVDVSGHDGQGE